MLHRPQLASPKLSVTLVILSHVTKRCVYKECVGKAGIAELAKKLVKTKENIMEALCEVPRSLGCDCS